jgi:hypothetical protein
VSGMNVSQLKYAYFLHPPCQTRIPCPTSPAKARPTKRTLLLGQQLSNEDCKCGIRGVTEIHIYGIGI